MTVDVTGIVGFKLRKNLKGFSIVVQSSRGIAGPVVRVARGRQDSSLKATDFRVLRIQRAFSKDSAA